MNMAIIMRQPYPHGMACTNRIHQYAKGIVELGGGVCIFIPRPTEVDMKSAQNKLPKGRYEGIKFEYTCGTPFRGETFIKRRFLESKGFVSLLIRLIQERKKIDTVLLVSNSPLFILSLWMLTTVLDMVYLQEKSELPFYNRAPNSVLVRVYQHLYTRYIYKCFKGIVVISQPLYDYFKSRIRRSADLLLVPVIVDTEEFSAGFKRRAMASVVYCGNFTESQDGILTLIKAFNSVAKHVDNVSLYLVGDTTSTADKEKVLRLLQDLSIENKVKLTGYVKREKLRELLCQATVLVLAKPASQQADYCFPSKLAEYLATGNPVVATKVGVVPYYLRDGDNAFLVEPDSADDLANKLEFVLSHPDMAERVGESGRQTAAREFSYKVQAKRIFEFVNKLSTNSCQ